MKLSYTQRCALAEMASLPRGESSAYELKIKTQRRVTVGTMNALASRGLVKAIGQGHMAFPQNASFVITDAGRTFLKERTP